MHSGTSVQDLFETEFVPADQFASIWHGSRPTNGENGLALAILQQAIEDLRNHGRANNPERRRIYAKAYRWVTSDDRSWLYSFASICELLDVAPEVMRSKLLSAS
jgi:hypothetical protein